MRLVAVDVVKLGSKILIALSQLRFDAPVLDGIERLDVTLALDDQAQRDGLHAPRRDPLLHRLPQHRARLVAHQPVQHPARLLRVHLVLVDVTSVRDRELDGVLGDLVEKHPPDGRAVLSADLACHVPRDRFAFPVRIGRKEYFARALRGSLELGKSLLLAGNRHVLRLEIVVDLDAQLLLGKIAQVADGGADAVASSEVLTNGLGLGRRLHNHE